MLLIVAIIPSANLPISLADNPLSFISTIFALTTFAVLLTVSDGVNSAGLPCFFLFCILLFADAFSLLCLRSISLQFSKTLFADLLESSFFAGADTFLVDAGAGAFFSAGFSSFNSDNSFCFFASASLKDILKFSSKSDFKPFSILDISDNNCSFLVICIIFSKVIEFIIIILKFQYYFLHPCFPCQPKFVKPLF